MIHTGDTMEREELIATICLTSFSNIQRERSAFYDEPFPDVASFNQTLAMVYSQKETTAS
jgi:hypothetical protein